MSRTQPTIRRIDANDADLPGEDLADFLSRLGGPAFITLPGQDSSRRRVIVTLLHGNEPSGVKGVYDLIKARVQPATDLGILVASVDAARHGPLFSHRFLPGERDLNRCFGPPYETDQEQLAGNILALLDDYGPEAVVDTHNTSSHSEPFCVAVRETPQTQALASIFCDNLIVIDQQLGTLLEYANPDLNLVTVEFGGYMDPNADWLARETLHRFVVMHELPEAHPTDMIRILRHPFRLETRQHLTVTFASTVDEDADLTVINTIDQLNFRNVPAGTTLGWFSQAHHPLLAASDASGNDRYTDYFTQTSGLLQTNVPMTVFMATTDPVVANTDCLLYFTPGAD